MESVDLDTATLEWLLDPANPALRAKVLTDLLDRSPVDPEVREAQRRIPEQPFVRATLEGWTSGAVWERSPYQKYRGATWTLAHLSEMGLPADHPVARQGVDYLLEHATRAGRIRRRAVAPLAGAQAVYWFYPIACLTARMLSVLARFGLPDHAATRGARATVVHLHLQGRGFDCMVMDRSLLPGCVMTVPEVLKALLSVPPAERTTAEDAVIADGIEVLKEVELYRYAPAQSKAFQAASKGMKADEARALKAAWAAEGRLAERTEKAGWLRFSFPHSYNSDLLEVLGVLALAGVERDPVVERGLELLLGKRTRNGRWKQVGGLNGAMWADRGVKGEEDPWITYRALAVLKGFGAFRG
jgi:hypothetical protein